MSRTLNRIGKAAAAAIAAALLVTAMLFAAITTANAAESVVGETEENVSQIETFPTENEPTAATDTITNSSSSNGYKVDKTKDVTLIMNTANADKVPIKGVGFTIYKITDDLNNIPKLEDVQTLKLGDGVELPLTDENGTASITLKGSEQGVYLVKNTTIPDTVTENTGDFIISLPYTYNGEEWQYEVTASPKFIIKEKVTEAPTSKTVGTVTANTGNSAKGAATTGDILMWTLVPAGALCAVSLVVVFIAKNKKKPENTGK